MLQWKLVYVETIDIIVLQNFNTREDGLQHAALNYNQWHYRIIVKKVWKRFSCFAIMWHYNKIGSVVKGLFFENSFMPSIRLEPFVSNYLLLSHYNTSGFLHNVVIVIRHIMA